jgi:hypothetical protein
MKISCRGDFENKAGNHKEAPKKKLQRVKEAKARNEEDSRNAVPIYGASDYRIWCLFNVALKDRFIGAKCNGPKASLLPCTR